MTLDGHLWWLLSRSAGVAALACMTASVLLGLALATRIAPRTHVRAIVALHEHLAVTGLVAIAVHGLALLGDRYLHPGLAGVAVPFLSPYRPVATGLGVIGGWIAAALGLSFYARRRIGAARWRKLHRWISVAWVLSVAHALFAGTDAASAWLRVPLLGATGAVLALLAIRLAGRRRPRYPERARPLSSVGRALPW